MGLFYVIKSICYCNFFEVLHGRFGAAIGSEISAAEGAACARLVNEKRDHAERPRHGAVISKIAKPHCAVPGPLMRQTEFHALGIGRRAAVSYTTQQLATLGALFGVSAREMKRIQKILSGFLVLALAAAQASAAPKKSAVKKPAAFALDSAFVSSFMSYEVGTLQMTGKTAADTTYSIGTLQLTGRAIGSTSYSIGTLSMTGKQEP